MLTAGAPEQWIKTVTPFTLQPPIFCFLSFGFSSNVPCCSQPTEIEMQQISIKPSFSPLILPTHNTIISAKWGKKRSESQRSAKLIINSMAHIASNLKIIPEPWDSLMREFLVVAGGNGGKFGVKNYLGGGGGGGGGGRNRRKQKLGFWVILLISSSLALWVFLEREKGSGLGIWVFLVFGVCFLVKGWREIKDWVLGFSCGAVIMGLSLSLRNNEVFLKWVDHLLVNSSKHFVSLKKRRKGKRWL